MTTKPLNEIAPIVDTLKAIVEAYQTTLTTHSAHPTNSTQLLQIIKQLTDTIINHLQQRHTDHTAALITVTKNLITYGSSGEWPPEAAAKFVMTKWDQAVTAAENIIAQIEKQEKPEPKLEDILTNTTAPS